MTTIELKNQIYQKINETSDESLKVILTFIQRLEEKERRKQKIMSFSGIWKDMDEAFLESMTTKLSEFILKDPI